MPRLSVTYGPWAYWCLVSRAPSPEERAALADRVAEQLAAAAPLAPGGHAPIILGAMGEERRRLEEVQRVSR